MDTLIKAVSALLNSFKLNYVYNAQPTRRFESEIQCLC